MEFKLLIKLMIFELSRAGFSLYDISRALRVRPSEAYALFQELSIEIQPVKNDLIH